METELIRELLLDIVEACEDIIEASSISLQEFEHSKLHWKAVTRDFAVVGEAVSKLPSDFKQSHPELPWRDMTDMRNKLIHDYQGIDLVAVHRIANTFVPKTLQLVTTMLSSLKRQI